MANSDNSLTKLKDKKISIWLLTEGETDDDGFGGDPEYIKVHDGKLWAYYRQTGANEYYRAMSYQYIEDAIFHINYRNDITTKMVILYDNTVYTINRVDDYEGYKRDIRISAKTDGEYKASKYPGMTNN